MFKLSIKNCVVCGEVLSSYNKKCCSTECRIVYKKNPRYRSSSYFGQEYEKRNEEIVGEALLPSKTLEKVALAYGISRERVRQIVWGSGVKYVKAKTKLELASKYFWCVWCGRNIPDARISRNLSKYCSAECRDCLSIFDLKNLRVCKNCGGKFFPNRNWKHVHGSTSEYCSTKCWTKSRKFKATNRLSVWSPEFIAKLNKFFEGGELEA